VQLLTLLLVLGVGVGVLAKRESLTFNFDCYFNLLFYSLHLKNCNVASFVFDRFNRSYKLIVIAAYDCYHSLI